MLEQFKSQLFKVAAPWTTSEQNVESIQSVIKGKDGVVIFISCILLITMIGIMFLIKDVEKRKHFKEQGTPVFIIIGVLFMIISTCYSFWHFMNSVLQIKFLQFPYRLFNPATVCIAFGAACFFSRLNLKVSVKRGIIVASMVIGIYFAFSTYERYYRDVTTEIAEQVVNGEIAGLGGGEEWLPIETEREDLQTSTIAVDSEGNKTEGKKQKGGNEFVFEADLSKEYYDVPYVWYKGYGAVTESGITLDWDFNENGMFRVLMPEGATSVERVIVTYEGTKWQRLSYVVSLLGVALFFVGLINSKKYFYKD